MKLDTEKWIDKEYKETPNDDYLGWGWKLNIGDINLGWLCARKEENGETQFSINVEHKKGIFGSVGKPNTLYPLVEALKEVTKSLQ